MPFLVVIGAIAGTFVLTYLAIGKEMYDVFIIISLLLVFLVGFFSVKVSLILLAFSMLLSPEIGVGATAKRAITGRLDDIILFTMTLGWLLRMAIIKDIGFMLKTKLNRPIVALTTIILLSTAMGAFRGNVNALSGMFFALKVIEYFFIFYVVVNYVQTQKEIEYLLSILLIVSGIVCIYALVHRASGGSIEAPFEGSEGEKNTLSGYLVLMGSVAAGVLFYTQNKGERIFLSLLLILFFGVLLISLSRSGWMSAIVSIIVLFTVAKTKNTYLQVVIVVLFIVPLFLPSDVMERFKYTFHHMTDSEEQVTLLGIKFDPSSSARLIGFWGALTYFWNHPILGYGLTGFNFIDGQYFSYLAELGLVGLGVFIWLLARVHRTVRTAMNTDGLPPRLQGMARGFYAGFWGVLAHATTANSFIIVRIAEPFWYITGLIAVMLIIHDNDAEAIPGSLPEVTAA